MEIYIVTEEEWSDENGRGSSKIRGVFRSYGDAQDLKQNLDESEGFENAYGGTYFTIDMEELK